MALHIWRCNDARKDIEKGSMHNRQAAVHIRIVDLRNLEFLCLLANVALYDANVIKIANVLVLMRVQRHVFGSDGKSFRMLRLQKSNACYTAARSQGPHSDRSLLASLLMYITKGMTE